MWISSCPSTVYWKNSSFTIEWSWHPCWKSFDLRHMTKQQTTKIWVYSRTLGSTPSSVSICRLCCVVVITTVYRFWKLPNQELCVCVLWLCIFFICKIDLAVLVPCSFMWILGSALTFWSELHWICEGSFRKCCHLHSIESYSPWTRNTIPFIYAIFYIFQQCFVVLSVHFLHLLESGYSYIVYCLWCC